MGRGIKSARKRLLNGMQNNTLKGINRKAAVRLRMKLKLGKLDDTLIYVSNVIGSSGKRCKCGCSGWTAHWFRKTNKVLKAQKCYVRGCGKGASVGAHVHVEGKGNKQMILPFCSFHNSRALTIALPLKKRSMAKDAVPAYKKLA